MISQIELCPAALLCIAPNPFLWTNIRLNQNWYLKLNKNLPTNLKLNKVLKIQTTTKTEEHKYLFHAVNYQNLPEGSSKWLTWISRPTPGSNVLCTVQGYSTFVDSITGLKEYTDNIELWYFKPYAQNHCDDGKSVWSDVHGIIDLIRKLNET